MSERVMWNFGNRPKRAVRQLMGIDGNPVAFKYDPEPAGKFKINLQIPSSATAQQYFDSEYGVWVYDAVNFWEQCITGLRYGSNLSAPLSINFDFRQLPGTLLGIAGPGNGDGLTGVVGINELTDFLNALRLYNSTYATVERATMHFSTDHYKINPVTQQERERKESFFYTCVHEMGHCIGYGLWNGDYRIVTNVNIPIVGEVRYKLPSFPTALTPAFPHNLVTSVSASYRINEDDPATVRFTGTEALAAWRRTMVGQSAATGIFIENVGVQKNTTMAQMGGTAGAHWKQAYQYSIADAANNWRNPINSIGVGAAPGLTGITDLQGRDMKYEIMTGWMGTNYNEFWIGEFSIQSMKDIGYETDVLPLTIPLQQYKSI